MHRWLPLWFLLAATHAAYGEDLLIKGGTVVTPEGSRLADVRVRGERVIEIGKLTREAADT